jgi:hypothetical protein
VVAGSTFAAVAGGSRRLGDRCSFAEGTEAHRLGSIGSLTWFSLLFLSFFPLNRIGRRASALIWYGLSAVGWLSEWGAGLLRVYNVT